MTKTAYARLELKRQLKAQPKPEKQIDPTWQEGCDRGLQIDSVDSMLMCGMIAMLMGKRMARKAWR